MTAPDQNLHDTIREAIGALNLGLRVGRTVPTALIAAALEAAADEYAAQNPDDGPQHLGAVWTFEAAS